MMEFITSRVALLACGLILLSAVAIPLSGIYDDEASDEIVQLAERDAVSLDSCMNSGVDEVYLDGSSLLPSAEYSLSLDGYFLTITGPDGQTYSAAMKNQMERMDLSYGERKTIVLTVEETTEAEEEHVPEEEEIEEEDEEDDEDEEEPSTIPEEPPEQEEETPEPEPAVTEEDTLEETPAKEENKAEEKSMLEQFVDLLTKQPPHIGFLRF